MAFPSKKGDLPIFSDGFPFWFSYIKSLSDLMINMHGYTAGEYAPILGAQKPGNCRLHGLISLEEFTFDAQRALR